MTNSMEEILLGRIENLEGKVHGVRAVLCALIDSHPDRAKFAAFLEHISGFVAESNTLPVSVSESYLEGQREIVQEMLDYAALPPVPLKNRT